MPLNVLKDPPFILLLVKLMICPAATGLLCASDAVIVRVVVPPGVKFDGVAFTTTVATDPGTKFTVAAGAKNPLALALMVAEPVIVGEVKVTCAVPVLSVNADVADKVPALVEKVTEIPAPTLVPATVARIAVLVVPSAVIDAAPAVSVIPLTTVPEVPEVAGV